MLTVPTETENNLSSELKPEIKRETAPPEVKEQPSLPWFTLDASALEQSLNIDLSQLSVEEEKPIGKGAFGTVYRGQYFYKSVAVKELSIANRSAMELQALQAEIQKMAELRHDNIVQLRGHYAHSATAYRIVMEFLPNGSLYELLNNPEKEIPWFQRFSLMRDISEGLVALHARKILHRDIKSPNVLLDKDYHAKISDLGLATLKQTADQAQVVGSLWWMAPELFAEKPRYSQQSDIYALGMVFWEIARRTVPYCDVLNGSEALVREGVKEGERLPIPDDCPKEIATLIERCWAQDPESDRALTK